MMPARYADGVTAQIRQAYITIGPGGLQIHTRDGAEAPWPAATLQRVWTEVADDPLTITTADHPDARIEIRDPDARRQLLAAYPQLGRRGFDRRALRWGGTWVLGTAAVVLVLYAGLPPLAVAGAAHIPLAWQSNLGARSEAEVVAALAHGQAGAPLCSNPRGTAVLDDLVRRLATAAAIPTPRVIVVRARIANAFALPGNRIVVTGPLLRQLRSGDGLAGVLAHEIGHLRHADWFRGFVQRAGWDALAELAFGSSTLGSVGATAVNLSFSREVERQADASAVETLTAAGLDTTGFEGFMRAMAAEHQNDGGFLMTHPADAERADAIKRASKPGGAPALIGAQWDSLKGICDAPP